MENHPLQLEHQTAPESTRGLFDPPVKYIDKRRSVQPTNPVKGNGRGHQRSRSAVLTSNHTSRPTFGLHTLTEEAGDNQSQKKSPSVTVDSLKDMINTLKSLPPVTIKESTRPTQHRRHQSISLTANSSPADAAETMQTIVQNTVDELRNITNERRRSKRASSISSTMDGIAVTRQVAQAEAESMMFGHPLGATKDMLSTMPRRHSTSRHLPSGESLAPLPTGRRRYSESLSGFDVTTLNAGGRRVSLQLPTLSENMELTSPTDKAGRRLTFNKPLTLDDSNKKMGHSRRSSRNLDYDWRTSTAPVLPPFSPHTFVSQSFDLVPFTPTRVSFAKDDANPHQRRPLFAAHLPFSTLPPLFRSRQLVRGILHVNKRNRSDAYVSCDDLDDDIYICGSRDRNRALEGDVVAVRLVDADKVLREKREKEEAKQARNGGHTRLPDEEDENEIIFGGYEEVDVVRPTYCGVVVAVLERAQNQVFSGTLTLMRPNNKRAQEEQAAKDARQAEGQVTQKEAPRIVWFKATDKRVPLIAIPIEQVPKDFVDNSESYATRLFVGTIKRWPITSLHPFGGLERELGGVTDLSVQIMSILADNNVTFSEFSDAVMACLPPVPFKVPSQIDGRRDLTQWRTFTIDPTGTKVLDDAFSIEKTDDGLFQVGVHVSDVSYFIKPHSALDKEARARGVCVDLQRQSVPMLPQIMTQHVTNLEPGETRLTMSVIWKLDTDGKIVDTWVGKSVIRSSAKLLFEDAQQVLEGKDLQGISDKELSTALKGDICSLAKLADTLKAKRTTTLSLRPEELMFIFDSQQDPPVGLSSHSTLPIVNTIREFHFLANKTVAECIASRLPNQALLRCHGPPIERKITELQAYAAKHLGVELDISSSAAMATSIRNIENSSLRKIVTALVLKVFSAPKTICAGATDTRKYSHYALDTPLFTQFTAPGRRYADIIVHRQLEYALEPRDSDFYIDRDTLQKLAQHCNVKKEASKEARKQTGLLYLSLYLLAKYPSNSSTATVVYRDATVVAVFDDYFDVIVPEYQLQKRVHLAHLPVWGSSFDQSKRALTMFWKKGVATPTGAQADWGLSEEEDDELDEDALLQEMEQPESDDAVSTGVDPAVSAAAPFAANSHNHDAVLKQMANVSTTPAPSSTASNDRTSSSRRMSVNRRASILKARLSDSTWHCPEQGAQTICALDKIKVAVMIEVSKPPPLVRVLAANPFA